MVQPNDRQPANIDNEIQSLQADIKELSKKQDTSSIAQMTNTWVGFGFTIEGIAVGALALNELVASILLFIFGVVSIVCSRPIASLILAREVSRAQNVLNLPQRRIQMPSALKTLATAATYVLLIIGCLYLVAGFSYVVLSSFDLLSSLLSTTIIATFIVLGMVHLILSYAAMRIRRAIE
jgi:hypothetical protein